jgi:hypothetical protein
VVRKHGHLDEVAEEPHRRVGIGSRVPRHLDRDGQAWRDAPELTNPEAGTLGQHIKPHQ